MNGALRIIDDSAHSPTFNMAADLFLMESCKTGAPVFLRLYEWAPACITIGYMQKAPEILDLKTMAKDGIFWIRRPTGGRAVLHYSDITYSVIFSVGQAGLGKNVSETYAVISKCLLAGLAIMGIRGSTEHSSPQSLEAMREVKLPCFLAPNRNEIMVQGRKLVGSAQKRTEIAVLQHGSMPLTSSYRTLPDYLLISDQGRSTQKELLSQKSISIEEIGAMLSQSDIRQAIIKGFIITLGIDAEKIGWTKKEIAAIAAIGNSEKFQETWLR
jgi:lipoyl(octanoyl) transferase